VVLGREVTVSPVSGEAFTALAQSISEDGSLRVVRADGTVETVTAADVSLRPVR